MEKTRKRALSLLLSAVLLSGVFGLTACQEETHTHDFGTEWKTSATQHWKACACGEKSEIGDHDYDDGTVTTEAAPEHDGVKTYTCKTCKATKTESYRYVEPASEKVTAAQWKAAFDFSEILKCKITVLGMESPERIDTFTFDGNKFRDYTSFDKDGSPYESERYSEYKPDEIYNASMYGDRGTVYRYSFDQESQKWTYTKSVITEIDTPYGILDDAMFEMFTLYDEDTDEETVVGDRFADFTLNETTGCYVLEEEGWTLSVKIRNGKLWKCVLSGEYEGESMTATATVTEIGSATVTLPEATERAH